MALTTPTLLPVVAWDATQEFTFYFNVVGGSRVVGNRLTIRNNATNVLVYQETQTTFRYEHTVPADTLTNGVYYNATIATVDNDGNISAESIPIQFWCYSTPSVRFTNISTGDVVSDASFSFEFEYNQIEGELLNTYVMNLYNSFGTLLSTSGVVNTIDGTPPFNGSYMFSGLEDRTIYLVELVATTINGTVVATNREEFEVQYIFPDIFTLVELHNNCEEGYITITSNVKLIEGEVVPPPAVYIDNKELDLRSGSNYWQSGYTLNGDLIMRVWFREPTPYSEIVRLSNTDGQSISLKFMQGYENNEATEMEAYMSLTVNALDGASYYIESNFVPIQTSADYYNIWMRRVDNVYQLQFAVVE